MVEQLSIHHRTIAAVVNEQPLSSFIFQGRMVETDHIITRNYNIALGKTGEVDIKEGADAAWKTITGAKANAWQVSAAYFF